MMGRGVAQAVHFGEDFALIIRLPALREAKRKVTETRVLGDAGIAQVKEVAKVVTDSYAPHALR